MTTNNAINSSHNGVSGSGSFVGDTNATLITPILGTPTSGNLSNCTALPLTGGGVTGTLLAASLLPFGTNNTKIINFTRNMTTATGTQTVSGVGFTPSLVIFLGCVGNSVTWSFGFSNASNNVCVFLNAGLFYDSPAIAAACFLVPSAGAAQSFVVNSFNSDGFELGWTKTSSPTGTAQITALCFY